MTLSVQDLGSLTLTLLLAVSSLGCRSSDRYLLTTSEIDAFGIRGLSLCFAVEPDNPQGVWWWDQGRDGCGNRASSVMQGYRGRVIRQPSGAVEATLEVPLKSGESPIVRLVFSDGTVRVVGTGATVSTMRRGKLDMPEKLKRSVPLGS